jgi:hypothetical protein
MLATNRNGRGGLRRGQLKTRHEQRWVPVRQDHQAGKPLELLGVIADDVSEVRARRQQHRV